MYNNNFDGRTATYKVTEIMSLHQQMSEELTEEDAYEVCVVLDNVIL